MGTDTASLAGIFVDGITGGCFFDGIESAMILTNTAVNAFLGVDHCLVAPVKIGNDGLNRLLIHQMQIRCIHITIRNGLCLCKTDKGCCCCCLTGAALAAEDQKSFHTAPPILRSKSLNKQRIFSSVSAAICPSADSAAIRGS